MTAPVCLHHSFPTWKLTGKKFVFYFFYLRMTWQIYPAHCFTFPKGLTKIHFIGICHRLLLWTVIVIHYVSLSRPVCVKNTTTTSNMVFFATKWRNNGNSAALRGEQSWRTWEMVLSIYRVYWGIGHFTTILPPQHQSVQRIFLYDYSAGIVGTCFCLCYYME